MGIPDRRIARAAIIGLVITASMELAGAPRYGGREAEPQQPQPQQQPQQQPPPPATQPPLFRTGINFVRVDVIVSDKQGNAVADLQPGDFDVTEDNKAQKIDTFKLIKLDGGAMAAAEGPPKPIRSDYDEEAEAAKEDVRLFAIFLDDYHVRRGASLGVREPLSRFVQRQLGPSDMIGVMYPLETTASVRMTRNHDAVVRGLQQFIGRKYEYQPKNQMEEQYANYPANVVEQIRNQVSLSAIRSLIVHMGSLKEGRKALILVSEGYTNMLPPQMRDPIASMPGLYNPNRGNPSAGVGDRNEERARFFSDVDLQNDLREIYDSANHNNVAIYAVDPRGLAVFEHDINEGVGLESDRAMLQSTMDTLRVLADQSDGRAIVNRNDLDVGMKQIIRDSSAYYLIGYNSTQAPADGKFHEIKVRVKRPGVQVRARKGYWALTAEETARALAPPKPGPPKPVEEALASVERPGRASVIRTWIGTSRGENGKTKVTFVWEPIPKAPGDRVRATDEPSRVAITAVGSDGAPYFRGRVPDLALASAAPPAPAPATGTTGGASAAPRPPSRVTFDAPPGKMQLRLSVEGAGAQVIDSEVREITVPDLTAPQATLGTPGLYRARTAREFQQLKTDADAVPVAAREFSRTDRLIIRVPAYAPGDMPPALTARLLNRAGQPMTDLPVAPLAASKSDQQIELPLAGLAPGEYIVEVKATGEGDVKQLVGFRVTG
jgi:VWFA-related protein